MGVCLLYIYKQAEGYIPAIDKRMSGLVLFVLKYYKGGNLAV